MATTNITKDDRKEATDQVVGLLLRAYGLNNEKLTRVRLGLLVGLRDTLLDVLDEADPGWDEPTTRPTMAKTTVFYDLRALIRQAIVEVYDTDFKGLSYTEVWELTGEAENLAGLLKDWGDIERMRGSANQWKNVERQDDGA